MVAIAVTDEQANDPAFELHTQRVNLAEQIVAHEWAQFQQVSNEGGPAECQSNWPTFHQMRLSQFLTWPSDLLSSYAADLDDADATHRNLLTEKYGRMMASTEGERYARDIEPHLPRLAPARSATQEQIIAQQVAWAAEFRAAYPRLGEAMRVLRTGEDTRDDTSFETYLRGELGTYSQATLDLYGELVAATAAAGKNLTAMTITYTVILGGYADLAEAEAEA